jgi:hypothetical protein
MMKARTNQAAISYRETASSLSASPSASTMAMALINLSDTIVICTHNPQKHPLPGEALLWIQWNLNRVAALCGAFEIADSFDEDDDGDDSDVLVINWNSEHGSTEPSSSDLNEETDDFDMLANTTSTFKSSNDHSNTANKLSAIS